jgi:hypothetical protein
VIGKGKWHWDNAILSLKNYGMFGLSIKGDIINSAYLGQIALPTIGAMERKKSHKNWQQNGGGSLILTRKLL